MLLLSVFLFMFGLITSIFKITFIFQFFINSSFSFQIIVRAIRKRNSPATMANVFQFCGNAISITTVVTTVTSRPTFAEIKTAQQVGIDNFKENSKVIHPKYYKHLKKGAHQSHYGRQIMGWFLAEYPVIDFNPEFSS